MYLVELIPSAQSDAAVLDALESFLVTSLGKGIIRAKDTPNFIANRIGVFPCWRPCIMPGSLAWRSIW